MNNVEWKIIWCYIVLTTALFLYSMSTNVIADEKMTLPVGEFSNKQMHGWVKKKFENETSYQLRQLDNRSVLKAVSHNSASGLVKKNRIDLEKFPFLNWRWRIENRLNGTFNEQKKDGDDYAARIYVVVSGGLAIWNTRALNYVWAKHAQKEDVWFNAYAGKRAVMTAVRSSEARVSVWYNEKRNIKMDFETYFNKKIRYIDAVALMSDTDNTQNNVMAYYGDIYFSSH